MSNRAAPIPPAGSHLGDTRHVGACFSSDDEETRSIVCCCRPCAGGVGRGDKAIRVVNPDQRDDQLRRVAAAGIDTAAECGRTRRSSSAASSSAIRSSSRRSNSSQNCGSGERSRPCATRRPIDVEAAVESPDDEVTRLRGCLNDSERRQLPCTVSLNAKWTA